ncbi:MAG TPA: RyR domain-containing protein [Xanthobacteraceae bacterium]|nr:RyR domain-containing protein [Xanthobacteraceae bacterium]
MSMFSPHDDLTESVKLAERLRKGIRILLFAVRGGRLSLPLVLSMGAVVTGVVGWTVAVPDFSMKSVATIGINTVLAFIPSLDRLQGGNVLTQLSALLGALTTFTGAMLIGLTTLHEQIVRARARYLWSDHVVVIGDTAIARRIAAEWDTKGVRVLHIVDPTAPLSIDTGPLRARMRMNIASLVEAAGLRNAKRIIVDLGSDTATLSAGRVLMHKFDDPTWSPLLMQPGGRRRPDSLALRVADPLLADQFFEIMDADRDRTPAGGASLRPTVFDENRVIARYALARHPLFKFADAADQRRVHALIIGFGDLGEKILEQALLTGIAGSLGEPRVTVLDREARRREAEFRTRRPAVLDTLDIVFLEFDIETDSLEQAAPGSSAERLRELARADGITAIFLALPSDAETARAVLLLRRYFTRIGAPPPPIFYRWRAGEAMGDLLRDDRDAFAGHGAVRLDLPDGALLREIADPDGREALARALHECYLRGQDVSQQAAQAWERLPDTLRRSNIRAADHLPAKLWTLGIDVSALEPGSLPRLPDSAMRLLSDDRSATADDLRLEHLARIEHERWMIDRKLDGWSYGRQRDNAKRLHPLLVHWEELKKSPDQVSKDVNVVLETLRFVAERANRQAGRRKGA